MSQPTPRPDDEIDLDDPEVQAWFEEHMSVLRQGAYGQRFLYFTLAGAFVVGLVAYVAGYFLRPSTATTDPSACWPTCSMRSALRSGPRLSSSCWSRRSRKPSVGRSGARSRHTKPRCATRRDGRTHRDRVRPRAGADAQDAVPGPGMTRRLIVVLVVGRALVAGACGTSEVSAPPTESPSPSEATDWHDESLPPDVGAEALLAEIRSTRRSAR